MPPVKETVPEPAVAVAVPPQVFTRPLGFARTRLAGKLSVNPTPLSCTVFDAGLVMLMVRVATPPGAMVMGLNDLVIAGGATIVSPAVLLVAPVPASVEVIAPVVLSFVPAVVPVTATVKVQDDPADGEAVNVPPDRLTLLLPAVAVIVPPPHEPVTVGVAATNNPAGRLSANPTPLRPLVVFGLIIVKLKALLEFNGMLVGLNDLVTVGLTGSGFTVTVVAADGALVQPLALALTV